MVHGKCDRARQWASLGLDDELSSFERALLENHLDSCASCAKFHAEIGALTSALRAAPHEPFAGIVLGRVRRRVHMRLAPAAAAMAVAAVGLGNSVSRFAQHVDVSPDAASAAVPDTMNVSTSIALQAQRARTAAHIRPRGPRSLRGGPVLSKP